MTLGWGLFAELASFSLSVWTDYSNDLLFAPLFIHQPRTAILNSSKSLMFTSVPQVHDGSHAPNSKLVAAALCALVSSFYNPTEQLGTTLRRFLIPVKFMSIEKSRQTCPQKHTLMLGSRNHEIHSHHIQFPLRPEHIVLRMCIL